MTSILQLVMTNHYLFSLSHYINISCLQIERYVRDLRVHTILEGTNEIMQLIVAKEMLK